MLGAAKLVFRQAAPAGGGGGGVTVVQQSGIDAYPDTGSGGNRTITLGATPTPGNTLILISGRNSGNDVSAPASGQGGVTTWTQRISTVLRSSQVFYGTVGGSPSASVVYNANYNVGDAILIEVSGLDTSSYIHGTPITNSGTSTTASTGSFTPTASAEVWLLSVSAVRDNAQSASNGSGWTDLVGSGYVNACAYQYVASASGSYSNNWTTSAAWKDWDTQLIAFNVA